MKYFVRATKEEKRELIFYWMIINYAPVCNDHFNNTVQVLKGNLDHSLFEQIKDKIGQSIHYIAKKATIQIYLLTY